MSAPLIVTLCVAGALLLFALTWLIAAYSARKALAIIEKRLKPEVDDRFAGREVLRSAYEANFFGLESKGLGQVRGNGALVLDRDEIYFLQAVSRLEITIPLEEITAVSVVRSHLRKWVARPLLRVDFRTGAGTDAAAWFVYDPPAWKEAVEDAARMKRAGQP